MVSLKHWMDCGHWSFLSMWISTPLSSCGVRTQSTVPSPNSLYSSIERAPGSHFFGYFFASSNLDEERQKYSAKLLLVTPQAESKALKHPLLGHHPAN